MILTIIAIKADSEGPIFADTPPRVGKNGVPFRLFKFRSMIPNAQKLLTTHPKLKYLLSAYKKSNYKLKNDPRITRVGDFIRVHSIDEFPQLLNVLIGDMSMVGPRPYYESELLEQKQQHPELVKLIKKSQTVLPGITGVWQVSGRSEIEMKQRIIMDADYADKKSFINDIGILLKTPWVVICGKGAY